VGGGRSTCKTVNCTPDPPLCKWVGGGGGRGGAMKFAGSSLLVGVVLSHCSRNPPAARNSTIGAKNLMKYCYIRFLTGTVLYVIIDDLQYKIRKCVQSVLKTSFTFLKRMFTVQGFGRLSNVSE
jgi:hypothetical protein